MLDDNYYQNALMGGQGADSEDGPGDTTPVPNYKKTDDPNTMIGKYGVKITKDEMDHANKNGFAWKDLDQFADYIGGWAHVMPDWGAIHPYYRTYPTGKIDGSDIALLMAKNDPQINVILKRNIAKDGEVPMYGPDDADALKKILSVNNPKLLNAQYDALIKPKK